MATNIVDVTPYVWINVVSTLSLVVGSTYIVQVVGGAQARMVESTTTPKINDRGFIVKNQEEAWSFTVSSGEGIYLRGHKNNTSVAINKVGA